MKKEGFEIRFFGSKFYVTFNNPTIPIHRKNDIHLATDNILRDKNRNIQLFPTQKAAIDFMKTYQPRILFDMTEMKKAAQKVKK